MKRLTTRIALDEISDHKTYLLCHSYIRNSELMQKIRELLQSVIRNRSNLEEYYVQCNYKKFMNGLLFSDNNFINFKKYKIYLIYSSVFNFIIAIKPLDQNNSEYEAYIFAYSI
jgi:hypothetical protein